MNRRAFLSTSGIGAASLLSRCLSTPTDGTAPDSYTATKPCTIPSDTDLVSMIPPAPDGLDLTVDDQASSAYLDEYSASAAVSADYTDGDDAILDDLTVRVFRFREGADALIILRGMLNNIEFDSGRVGVGVLAGRVGFVAAAQQRQQAASLLARSPVLSNRCLKTQKLLPSKTRAPDDTTSRSTATSD